MSGYLIAGLVVGVWVVVLALWGWKANTAVVGWEDEDGFHEGRQPGRGWPVRIDDERND